MYTINKIFSLLESKGKSQKDFAEYLGVHNVVITDWKTGKSKSYLKYIQEIAKYFDVTADDLLGINIRPKINPQETTKSNPEALEYEIHMKELSEMISKAKQLEKLRKNKKNDEELSTQWNILTSQMIRKALFINTLVSREIDQLIKDD